MAWWPFGKKKASPEAPASPAEDEPAEGRTIAVPPPNEDAGPPAPTMLVPPEFAQNQVAPQPTDEMVTLAPGTADPFAANPGDDPLKRTLEDPDSPKVAKGRGAAAKAPSAAPDPFAAPAVPGSDLLQTVGDAGDSSDDALTIAPEHSPPPMGPRNKAAAKKTAVPADPFEGDPDDQHTLEMPGRVPAAPNDASDGLTFTAPGAARRGPSPAVPAPPPPPPAPAAPASEETPMLAKTALSPDKVRLGRALLAAGPITQERLAEELEKSGKSQSVLGKALLKSNFPKEEDLLAALVATIRIPKINVKNTKIPLETIRIVPKDVAKRWHVLPIEKIGDILVVVSPTPSEEEALASVRKATGCSVFPFQCDADRFEDVLDGYYARLGEAPSATLPEGFGAPPPPPAASPAPRAAGAALAAIADDGQDEWERVYAAAGPVPAEEVLL